MLSGYRWVIVVSTGSIYEAVDLLFSSHISSVVRSVFTETFLCRTAYLKLVCGLLRCGNRLYKAVLKVTLMTLQPPWCHAQQLYPLKWVKREVTPSCFPDSITFFCLIYLVRKILH